MKNLMIKFSRLKLLVLLAFVFLTCAIAVAPAAVLRQQDAGEAEPVAEPVAEPRVEPATEIEKKDVLPLKQRLQKEISVEFRNTPIEDALMLMADQANVDIVKSPAVKGSVTVKLTNIPLEEALDNILAAHGYRYVADKNMIRVASADEIEQVAERIISRIYRITYADIKEVEAALKRFISQQGSLSSSPATSNIIVTDTVSKIKAIDEFIEEIDRITPQILVEVRIYDITSQETLDLGVQWEAGRRNSVTGAGVGTLGEDLTSGSRNPFLSGLFNNATSETGNTVTGALRFGWLNSSIDIDMVLRAQKEDIQAKLLANPRIMVLDNEKALFDIVREIPYEEQTSTASTTTQAVKFKKVGVKLEVTPHVTRDGMIRLHIVPEFGVVVGTYTEGSAPTVDTRKVDTITLVQDGQTVVLGGLRKKDVAQQINKVPLLGDIPLLGALFKFEGEDTLNSEIVVFITPRIIEQPVLTEAEKGAYEATEFSRPVPTLTRAEKK